MKKKRIRQIENALQRAFMAVSPIAPEPAQWRRDAMRTVQRVAITEPHEGFRLFSRRQERILWRSAWAALAAVTLVCAIYFSSHKDSLNADFASFAIVDMEGY